MQPLIPLMFFIAIDGCAGGTSTNAAGQCPAPTGVSLQVFGSGRPIADDARASSGYVVWIDGKSRVLIDANVASVRGAYERSIVVADDLECMNVQQGTTGILRRR